MFNVTTKSQMGKSKLILRQGKITRQLMEICLATCRDIKMYYVQ